MKTIIGLIAGLLLGGAGVWYWYAPPEEGPPAEMTEAEIAQIEAEVLQAITARLDAYAGVVASKDLEGWWSYWTPDAHVMEPGMDLAGDDFYKFGKEFFESGGEVFSAEWVTKELFVHGEVAYQLGEIHESFRYPGEEPAEAHNHIFVRWDKQADGVWKMSRFLAGPIDAPSVEG